jgi:hypothetical protein
MGAVALLDPQTQNNFLQNSDPPIASFNVTGVEFTDDVNRVNVVLKVRSVLVQVGQVDRTVTESWIWKDGKWLMQFNPPPNMFGGDNPKQAATPTPLQFQLTKSVVDDGRHVQGQVVEGKIQFRAKKDEINLIRPLQAANGLSIGSPVWTGPEEGYLPYQWETTLLSQNVDQTVRLEAIAFSDQRATANLQFRLGIQGRVGFKQIPEVANPAVAGQIELQIQNLTAKPLKILSVVSQNRQYVVDENIPESIDPGKSGRLLIRYSAQLEPTGASLAITLSESLTPSGTTRVPLNVMLPDVKRSQFSAEDLKRFAPTSTPVLPPAPGR